MAQTSPYSTRFKIAAAAAVALAGVLLFVAFTSLGDDEDPVLSEGDQQVVENLIPRRDAQVPQQSSVGIDLVTGWAGTLAINGVEIPEDELTVTPEIGLIMYTPGDGKTVDALQSGQNCVNAIIWRISDGRGVNDRTIPWCFEVV
ncbi:MAG TPA: hypothetical protein VFB77_16615 [Acidimicrobiales bacterium]|nr:hypothetical protein [Acidimicrobiales bacterium]